MNIPKVYHNHVKSLFQVDFMRIIESAAELCYIKGYLEIKLKEAKDRNPNIDYSEQDKIIAILKRNIDVIYEVERDNAFLAKEIMKINNIASALQSDNFNHRLEIQQLKKQIAKHQEEIVMLKED